MKEIELEVAGLHGPMKESGVFNLVLKEKGGARFLPIVIGTNEAKAIALETNHIAVGRPQPYDLLLQLCDKTDCRIEKVLVNGFRDGIYFVHIYIMRNGELLLLDARISDAVVVALKRGAPILIAETVFNQTCYDDSGRVSANSPLHRAFDDDDDSDDVEISIVSTPKRQRQKSLSECSVQELQTLIDQAVEEENYELAAEIDAELNRRPDYGK